MCYIDKIQFHLNRMTMLISSLTLIMHLGGVCVHLETHTSIRKGTEITHVVDI